MSLSKMLEDYRNKKREFPTYDELAAIASPDQCADPIVERNVSLLRERSTVGVQKYGTTLADNKLPLRAWLNHALEEALDQANYLQAAMAEIDSAERALPPLPQYFPDVTNIRADEELRAQQYAQDYARSALASVPVQTGHFPQRDQSKPTEQQGVFQKFDVRRTDGSSAPGGKHHDCRYFVLDVDHDALAKPALRAYATACAVTHPDLSADMVKRFDLAPVQPVAMPHGWKITRESGYVVVKKIGVGGYATTKNDENIASSILFHLASDMLAIHASQEDSKELTDSQIVEAVRSVGVDTRPSKFGFADEQIEGMSVTVLRQVITAITAITAKAEPTPQ